MCACSFTHTVAGIKLRTAESKSPGCWKNLLLIMSRTSQRLSSLHTDFRWGICLWWYNSGSTLWLRNSAEKLRTALIFSFPWLQSRWWCKAGGSSFWKHKNCAYGERVQHQEKCQPIPCICWSQWEDMFPNSRSDSAFKTICWGTGSLGQQPNVTGFLTFPAPNKTQVLLTWDHNWLTIGQTGSEQ